MGAQAAGQAPTGEQWRISAGPWSVTVVETGGGLRTLAHEGQQVLAGYEESEPIIGARGQFLLPWPNRIRDGAYEFDGARHQLALSEPARHNASHGLARWCSWRPQERTAEQITLRCRLMAQSGYPWTLDLTAGYALDADGLTVTVTAVNRSATPAPFAAGMHPYLTPSGTVDDAVLTVPAHTRLLVDDRLLPTGTAPVDTDHDFRSGRRIGELHLDDAFTDLDRDTRGIARCHLDENELWLDEQWRWVQTFTADTLSGPRRRASVALEPMTSPPDAFNSGRDLLVLEPGEPWSGSFGLTRRRRSAP